MTRLARTSIFRIAVLYLALLVATLTALTGILYWSTSRLIAAQTGGAMSALFAMPVPQWFIFVQNVMNDSALLNLPFQISRLPQRSKLQRLRLRMRPKMHLQIF